MIIDKINKKFKSISGLRCLFIFDPQMEHEDALLKLPEAYTLIDVDHQYFNTKVQLATLLSEDQKVVLYHKYAKPKGLYPLQGYRHQFRVDGFFDYGLLYRIPNRYLRQWCLHQSLSILSLDI